MIGIKIMAMAIVGTMLSLILKEQKSYFGIATALLCAMTVFFMGLPYLERIVSYVRVLYSSFSGSDFYMSTLLKITGIASVSVITSGLCADAGMSALSGVVNLCAKIICLCLTLPIIGDFFYELLSVLP
ncbi:MAG: hypothetical protein IJB50_00110 [Clostridia bacterium]|nr:hypothetical protein [Clostridia bacterium]